MLNSCLQEFLFILYCFYSHFALAIFTRLQNILKIERRLLCWQVWRSEMEDLNQMAGGEEIPPERWETYLFYLSRMFSKLCIEK